MELVLRNRVEMLMKREGFKTKGDFCEKIGISRLSLRRILDRNDCKLSILIKMCDALNCTMKELTGK